MLYLSKENRDGSINIKADFRAKDKENNYTITRGSIHQKHKQNTILDVSASNKKESKYLSTN